MERTSFAKRAMLGVAGLGTAAVLAVGVISPALGMTYRPNPYNAAIMIGTVAKGQASVALPIPWAVGQHATALCTLQSDPGIRSLKYATINRAHNSIVVFLDGKAVAPVKVACQLNWEFGPISGPVSGPVSGALSKK
jgi:hypothetical protein